MTKKTKIPVVTTVRFPPELHSQMAAVAEETFTSHNTFILQAVAEKLKRSNWLDQREDLDDGK